ncbi:MAG: hypothetical protein J5797_08105 [Prevotella sp.]|nr:hypothetical protein [Prevotella sp.]
MNNELLQPLWYEKGTPDGGSFFFGRPSTAAVQDVVEGVCDYRLFPIRRSDANLLLYHTIWDMLSGDNPMDFFRMVCGKDSPVSKQPYNGTTEWTRPYFLFPSDAQSERFSLEIYHHPFIVAGYSMTCCALGESGLVEEDDEPLLTVYYVPEWEFVDGEPEVVYREYSSHCSPSIPYFEESPEKFRQAICNLLAFIDKKHIYVVEWKQRLELALRMIDTKANELHILHNVGLYDIDALWKLLVQKNQVGEELFRVSSEMNRCLHQYAMAVVNLIDWKKGGRFSQNCFIRKVEIKKDMPPSFWNDVEAMERAFEWTPAEEEQLTRAFYGTNRSNAGANYVDVLRELVRQRMIDIK